MVAPGPTGTSFHNYGPTSGIFDPERWMTSEPSIITAAEAPKVTLPAEGHATTTVSARETDVDPSGPAGFNGPPDPMTFSLGPRDCVGQSLARLELQVVVASLVAAFKWSPGQILEKMMLVLKEKQGREGVESAGAEQVAAAMPATVQVLYDIAQYHVTLQPKPGMMMLKAAPRTGP